jgi:hypothetical protein
VAERKKRVIAIFWKNVTFLTRDKKPYLPDPAHLYSHQIFADYILDSKQSVGEFDASSAQQEILHFIETFWATKKRRLLTILLETGFLPKEATEDSNPDDFLGLAMAVFECCRYYIFFGWEDAGVHIELCSNHAPEKLSMLWIQRIHFASAIEHIKPSRTWHSSFTLISDSCWQRILTR